VDLALPLGADVERIMQAMREVGETLAPAPAGTKAGVELADVSDAGTLLRLHVWAADPLHRREIASDVRLALLRRLTADGLVGAKEDGADP